MKYFPNRGHYCLTNHLKSTKALKSCHSKHVQFMKCLNSCEFCDSY